MSQVDQLHLLPQLFWFIVIFLGFYILYLAYVFPVIYSSFRLRVLEYRRLVNVIFLI